MGAFLFKGDALDKASVDKCFASLEECDAVVSTIGGTPADPRADSEGNLNLIEAAFKKGVKKFLLVTSIGVGSSSGAPSPQVYEVLKPVLIEKAKAEGRLVELGKTGKMQYVIVRPGGLKSEPATGTAVLTENTSVCGAVHRADVAELAVKALLKDAANNKVLSCVDKAQLMGAPQFDVFKL